MDLLGGTLYGIAGIFLVSSVLALNTIWEAKSGTSLAFGNKMNKRIQVMIDDSVLDGLKQKQHPC